ncbi:MAG: ABC transporter permease subunit [Acidimicrobiia bacterium]|nr:ABC transporter permease subunit [Actinomycetota bacterium]MBL6925237.1 ABC transporter permease subunit [Acidimicrobiia bacterium]MBL6926505.1 ABC transporter permease subunit [Acidimicrobiia bacterium]
MTAPTNQASSTHAAVSQRVPLWRDAVVVKWTTQVVTLVLVLAGLWFLASQAGDNLVARNINIGFDFLERPPDIQLSEGIDTHPATGGRALWVGMVNTLRMAAVGIIFATVLGVVVGLARLSNNWLVRRLGTIWVETLRNIPLLVQIIFYSSVLSTMPRVGLDTGPINGWLHISNKGLSMPRVFIADGFYQWAMVMAVGGIAAHFVRQRRVRLHDESGANTSPVIWALGTLIVFGLIGIFIHPLFGFIGPIMGAVAGLLDSLPLLLPQILLSATAVLLAGRWIRSFLAGRRSAVGHLALSDDDYFRIIFTAIAALMAVAVAIYWTGLSSWILNSGSDLFRVIEAKFNVDGAARPFDAMRPDIVKPGKFANYGTNGLTMTIGFAAVFFGVVFYTSAFIGEIVRGGILAVPKGQTEAASAVGLSRAQSLRHIILPQAIRIILPPMGNQYLNLTKNTSLAIAVGYSDIVQVGQTVYNQTGKTLPVVAVWMLFYLATSLTISVVVNYYNVRMKLVER